MKQQVSSWNEALNVAAATLKGDIKCKYKHVLIVDETLAAGRAKALALKNLAASDGGHSGAHKAYAFEVIVVCPAVVFNAPVDLILSSSALLPSLNVDSIVVASVAE